MNEYEITIHLAVLLGQCELKWLHVCSVNTENPCKIDKRADAGHQLDSPRPRAH